MRDGMIDHPKLYFLKSLVLQKAMDTMTRSGEPSQVTNFGDVYRVGKQVWSSEEGDRPQTDNTMRKAEYGPLRQTISRNQQKSRDVLIMKKK